MKSQLTLKLNWKYEKIFTSLGPKDTLFFQLSTVCTLNRLRVLEHMKLKFCILNFETVWSHNLLRACIVWLCR